MRTDYSNFRESASEISIKKTLDSNKGCQKPVKSAINLLTAPINKAKFSYRVKSLILANICLFKVNNRNTRKRYEI